MDGREKMRTAALWTSIVIVAVLLLVFAALAYLRLAAAWRESIDALPPSSGRMVSTTAGDIFVQERGPNSGVPVIIVPGTAAWSGFWLGVADDLGAFGYRAVAVHLPPFGFSARSDDGAYSRVDQAMRLAALIEALDLKKPIVVGHSFGAGAVVELAMVHPDALAGMVLVDPALGLAPDGQSAAPNPILRWAVNQPAIAQVLVAATLDNPLWTRSLLADLLFRKNAATQRQADILAVPYSRVGTTAAYARWLPHLLLPETTAMSAAPSSYAQIKTPTAMIWGERDRVRPFEQGKRLLQLIPGSRLELIGDVGHIPHIEDQANFRWVLSRALVSITRGHATTSIRVPPHVLQQGPGGNDRSPLAAAYRQAIGLDPKNAVLHFQLGAMLQTQMIFDDEAVAEYREAIRLDPKFADPHAKLGDIWLRKAKNEEAVAEYSEAIRLTSSLYAKLAGAWSQLFKLDEAIAEYREGVRLNPNEASLHGNLSRLLKVRGGQERDKPEGIALLREACTEVMTAAKLAPSEPWWAPIMGATDHMLGDQGRCPP